MNSHMYNIQEHPPIDPAFSGSLFADAASLPPEILKLCNFSEVPVEEIPQAPEIIIPRGYNEDLVCIGHRLGDMVTLGRRELEVTWDTYSMIVPAVMKDRKGYIPKKKEYRSHTNENTGKVYATVVSIPHLPLDEQLKVIIELRREAKLALVVWMGENHIEGWFSTCSMREERLAFCRRAMARGADWRIKLPYTPYGLPGGVDQETGRRNTIVFVDKTALLEMHWDASMASPEKPSRSQRKNARQRARSNGSRGKKQRS